MHFLMPEAQSHLTLDIWVLTTYGIVAAVSKQMTPTPTPRKADSTQEQNISVKQLTRMHQASPLGETGPVPTPIHAPLFLVRRKQSGRFINDPGPGLGTEANFLLHRPCSSPGRPRASKGTAEQLGEYD